MWTKLSFWEKEDWALAMIPWSFNIILNFPNFLRSYVLSRSTTRLATGIYRFITNNQTLCHLSWKENLVKHQKFSKFSWLQENQIFHILAPKVIYVKILLVCVIFWEHISFLKYLMWIKEMLLCFWGLKTFVFICFRLSRVMLF